MRKSYTLLVVDRSTGVIRRSTISLRAIVFSLALAMSGPLLIGVGASLSARAEIESLRTLHTTLDEENASYRAAARVFAEQTRLLQDVIDQLSIPLEAEYVQTPARVTTLNRVPGAGGTAGPAVAAAWLPLFSSPEDTYQVLGGALQRLMSRLPSIERTVQRREALAVATPSIWPTQGWLTASFGVRSDPFTGERGFHQGIDISTAEGQPVFATADGIVESASSSGDYGNLVVLQHGFGLSTRYGHLSRLAVADGMSVKRGDVIGFVGATGRATGPHLHYEILVNGTPIDPLQILTAGRQTLAFDVTASTRRTPR